MNPDGTPKGGRTCQGYKDDSFWARGQAWGVYGSAIGYTYTHDEKFLDVFRKALEFYLSRLPEDMIPCWDMLFAPESGEPRDSSSAAIVACGLLEAAKYVDDGQFPAGSMLPKVEAAMKFVRRFPDKKAVITSLDKAVDALEGKTGTVITFN